LENPIMLEITQTSGPDVIPAEAGIQNTPWYHLSLPFLDARVGGHDEQNPKVDKLPAEDYIQ
jgi:hypothetical protein